MSRSSTRVFGLITCIILAPAGEPIWHYHDMAVKPRHETEKASEWLKAHGFKLVKPFCTADTKIWARGCCHVRVRHSEQTDYSIDMRKGEDSGWESIDIIAQQAKDANRLLRAPIEIAASHFLQDNVSKVPSPGMRLYAACRPWAHLIKVILQMNIGLGAVAALCWALTQVLEQRYGPNTWKTAANTSIYVITAALGAAGAVELAYTLYTPGPDEALDPLMLGLSAGILLLVTRSDISISWQFTGALLGVISLGVLFIIRRRFIDDEKFRADN